MRILVTGATGQLGATLRTQLAPLGEVIATASPRHGLPGLRALDLGDLAAVASLVRELRPDVIVNAAAYTAVDKAESEEALAHRINAEGPRVLAEEARRLGARLIHYSTDYVFDGKGERPWVETDATAPLNAYGRSKLAGERAIAGTGCAHWIMRTSWVFSEHGNNFVKTMLRLGKDRPKLSVVADQFGAPTSTALLARATERFIATPSAARGIYHLANAGETSWQGFASEVFRQARALGMPLAVTAVDPITTDQYPTPAVRPGNSRFDCAKIERALGLERETWQDAVAAVLPRLQQQQPAS
jgi:dTDP-4-dehydrorhamnose reductase